VSGRLARHLHGSGKTLLSQPRQRRVLAATLVGVFVTSFPSVILVAALPDIADRFHVGEESVGWVITAPTIAAAVLVPLFGKLGDLRGHRRVFLVGFAASMVFALLSAFAWDLWVLVLLRTLSQAAGVACTPTALALLMATHDGNDRPRALGMWAFAAASAPVIGLLAGGPLIGGVTWRGLFVMQAAIGALAMPLCLSALPETPKIPDVRFDLAGGFALMLASGSAVFALDRSARWGFSSPIVVGSALLAPIALWTFVRIERSTSAPLFPLELARRRAYVAPTAGDSLVQVPSIGAFFLAPLVLHNTFDYSVAMTAYLLIPMPLGMAVFAPIGGWLTVRMGERRTSVIGCLGMLVAVGISAAGNETETLWLLLLGFAMHGGAMGLNRPSFAAAAAGALDAETSGVGMAVMRMLSQLGSAAAISIAVATRAAGGFGLAYASLAVVGVVAVAVTRAIVESVPEPMDVAMVGMVPALDT
jgi:MFS family permease